MPHADPTWTRVADAEDVRPELLAEIKHFFEVYKDLEAGKHVTVGEWEGREPALEAWAPRARALAPAARRDAAEPRALGEERAGALASGGAGAAAARGPPALHAGSSSPCSSGGTGSGVGPSRRVRRPSSTIVR